MFRLLGPSSLIRIFGGGTWFSRANQGTSVQAAPVEERKTQIRFPELDTEWDQRPYPIAPNVVDIPHKRYREKVSDPIDSAIREVHNTINRYGVKQVLVYCGMASGEPMPGVHVKDSQPARDAQELLDRFPERIVESATNEPIVADIAYDQRPRKTRIYVVFTVGQKLDDKIALFRPV